MKDKLTANKLTIDLEEDSTLDGSIVAKNLIVLLDEDSVVNINGSAESLSVDANEDCAIKGYDFIVNQLDIRLKEDCEAELTVNGKIDLRAKEDSYLYYKGEAQFIRKQLTGDSEVKKR